MIQPIFTDITTLHMFGRMFPDGPGVSPHGPPVKWDVFPLTKSWGKETDNEEFKQKGVIHVELNKSETKGKNLSVSLHCLVKLGENSGAWAVKGPKGVCMCYFGISQEQRLMGSIVALWKCPSRHINAYMWNLKQWHRWSYLQTEI